MDFAEMMKINDSIDAEAVRLRDKLIADICDLPLNGEYINDGKNGGPVIALVKFSELQKTHNWCPHYHLPPEQARAIKRNLGALTTAHGICAAVRKMLIDGFVKHGEEKTFFNDRTMDAIRKSELGKYVIASKIEKTI